MADTPDALKRLSEIEHRRPGATHADVRWLLDLTRALLESQGELMEWQQAVRRTVLELGSVSITTVDEIAARAEKVRKGEV